MSRPSVSFASHRKLSRHDHEAPEPKVCDASEDWSLECSHTDAGDPWCIIYDQHQQGIVLHIARIERKYLVVWPREQRSEKTAIMAVAIDIALEGLKAYRRRVS